MSGPDASTAAFYQLHAQVQRWIYRQNWAALHPIQAAAINAFFQSKDDLIIAAPTAGGKIESAFLPIFLCLVEDVADGIRVLCISPLRALINDHHHRLSLMGKDFNIPVQRWHGDVPQSQKAALRKNPRGVLLITPESLAALLVLQGSKLMISVSVYSLVRFVRKK